MILVDTSVWVEHLRRGDADLQARLEAGDVLGHPFVVGELALGNLADRAPLLRDLDRLPQAVVASPVEVRLVIEAEPLHGLGLGYVDACLLASTMLTPDARLWTQDRRLAAAATRMGRAWAQAPP
jgi:predicted nucleic acid-binding protein